MGGDTFSDGRLSRRAVLGAVGALGVGTLASVGTTATGGGDLLWTFETTDEVRSSPTVVDGTVFVGSEDDTLYAVDAGVDGSSAGSRVRLGTLGHHDRELESEPAPFSGQRIEDAATTESDTPSGDGSTDGPCSVQVPERATADSPTETPDSTQGPDGGPATSPTEGTGSDDSGVGATGYLVGGGGFATLLGAYALLRRRRDSVQSATDDE